MQPLPARLFFRSSLKKAAAAQHYGNVTGQTEYSRHSKRWRYPELYYDFTETIPGSGGATVHFVMIDTNIIYDRCPNGAGHPWPGPPHSGCGSTQDKCKAGKLCGPAQVAWVDSVLADSTADYIVVSGHHPVYSICEHGPTLEVCT